MDYFLVVFAFVALLLSFALLARAIGKLQKAMDAGLKRFDAGDQQRAATESEDGTQPPPPVGPVKKWWVPQPYWIPREPLLGSNSDRTKPASSDRQGCYNRKPFKQTVAHSQNSSVTWPWRFDTPGCQYDRKTEDERCKGCGWIGREE